MKGVIFCFITLLMNLEARASGEGGSRSMVWRAERKGWDLEGQHWSLVTHDSFLGLDPIYCLASDGQFVFAEVLSPVQRPKHSVIINIKINRCSPLKPGECASRGQAGLCLNNRFQTVIAWKVLLDLGLFSNSIVSPWF